jgi:hypothetical protein
MRLITSVAVFAAAMAVAVPASAQGTGQTGTSSSTERRQASAKPPAPKLPVGFRAYVIGEGALMSATNSFEAITGSAIVPGVGGGAEVLNIWKRLFVRVALASGTTDGGRAFVIDGEVIPTGVGIDIGIRTLEVGAGWRMHFTKHPRLVFYYSAGGLLVNYTERSAFATAGENVDETFRGYSAQAGLEMVLWKWLTAGVEGQYRVVPDALGAQGVSEAYREDNLNAAAVRVMLGVRLRK